MCHEGNQVIGKTSWRGKKDIKERETRLIELEGEEESDTERKERAREG